MLLGGEVLPSLAWASLGLLECTVCSFPTAGLAMCLKMIKRAVQKATVINPLMLNTFVSGGCLVGMLLYTFMECAEDIDQAPIAYFT